MSPAATIPATMKAWICRSYGDPNELSMESRPVPTPGDHEVLVKVRATTVSSADVRIRALNVPRGFKLISRLVLGLTKPRQPVLGTEFSGTIVACGKSVSGFKVGDEVFGFPGAAMRCHAQYLTMATTKPIALKPDNLSFDEAASLSFGAMTALHFLKKAGVSAGQSILVIGASGAVGSAMVQLAKHLGASVTGVTSSGNVELVRSLGADRILDYTREDFLAQDQSWDVIADTVAASSFAKCHAKLNENGRYLCLAGGLTDLLARPIGSKKSIGGPAAERAEYFTEMTRLAAEGVLRPVIDRTFEFSAMPSAHAYVDTGRKKGAVVVKIDH
ncbi:MAG: NAD(P)-dependent alcohol dehydrogenase [Rhizobiaceae bacterium]